MGYFIKHQPFRKSSPKWKVQFVSYKKIDIKPECQAKKPKREWDIPKPRWPLRKTMRKHFGYGVTSYAGRKGFAELMLSKNQSFENISVWMGHSTIQRTWRSYKSRRKFHLAGY